MYDLCEDLDHDACIQRALEIYQGASGAHATKVETPRTLEEQHQDLCGEFDALKAKHAKLSVELMVTKEAALSVVRL